MKYDVEVSQVMGDDRASKRISETAAKVRQALLDEGLMEPNPNPTGPAFVATEKGLAWASEHASKGTALRVIDGQLRP